MTTNNLIIIKGGSYNDIKKALRQWIDLYADDLIPDMTFEHYKNGSRKLLVYISNVDSEGDNVNVVTENDETYKIDFGGKITKVSGSKWYQIPYFEPNSNAEVFKLDKKEIQIQRSGKSKANPLTMSLRGCFLAMGIQ